MNENNNVLDFVLGIYLFAEFNRYASDVILRAINESVTLNMFPFEIL